MSIVKRTDNWGQSANLSDSNWTGKVPRQARIGGQWAANLERQKRIPVSGYVCAVLAVLAFWFANFL
jgi:hypothetical protein